VPPLCSTWQRNYKKKRKIFAGCLADTALGKENTKKKLKTLCRVPTLCGTRQRKFEKIIKKSLPGTSDMAPGKARADGAGAVTATFLYRVPDLHSAKSLPGVR
jgi:hypothetical protein